MIRMVRNPLPISILNVDMVPYFADPNFIKKPSNMQLELYFLLRTPLVQHTCVNVL